MLVLNMDVQVLLQKYNTLFDDVNLAKQTYGAKQNVAIIAATKYSDIDTIENLASLNLGIAFAESKAQCLRDKANVIPNATWHFMGRIQSNKLKYIIPIASLIHSVDSIETLESISEYAVKHGKVVDMLIQLNISGEAQKGGVELANTNKFFDEASQYKSINIIGLMGMAEYTNDESIIEQQFESLRVERDRLNSEYSNLELRELSMGMSGDYRLAIKHGSTMIRVGSVLFG